MHHGDIVRITLPPGIDDSAVEAATRDVGALLTAAGERRVTVEVDGDTLIVRTRRLKVGPSVAAAMRSAVAANGK